MDYSSPGSSVQGILPERILEWGLFPPPGDLPGPGIESVSLALAGRFFTTSATWEAPTRPFRFDLNQIPYGLCCGGDEYIQGIRSG